MSIMLFFNPSACIEAMLSSSERAVNLCISLISIYAIWLGILEIVDKTGLGKTIAKILKPVIRFLFGEQPDDVNEQIAINLSANILGMGNASTPSGIKAMEMLDQKTGKASKEMIMLMLINSMSLQIVPTTLISLRVAYSSQNPTDIFLPIIITSLISTFLGVLLVKIFYRNKPKKQDKKNEKGCKKWPHIFYLFYWLLYLFLQT